MKTLKQYMLTHSKRPIMETPQDSDDMGLKDDKVPISVSTNNEEEKEMFSRSQHQ